MSEASSGADAGFELVSRRLGALPLVNHLLTRAGVPALLARYLPAEDARYRLAPATAIGLVVLNLLAGREPLYGLGEWAARYEPARACQEVCVRDLVGFPLDLVASR